MEKRHLEIANKSDFLKLLDAISKINDSGVILDIKEDKISSLVSSIDSTLILCSEYKANLGFENTINVPDVKKLRNVLDTVDEMIKHGIFDLSDRDCVDAILQKIYINLNQQIHIHL